MNGIANCLEDWTTFCWITKKNLYLRDLNPWPLASEPNALPLYRMVNLNFLGQNTHQQPGYITQIMQFLGNCSGSGFLTKFARTGLLNYVCVQILIIWNNSDAEINSFVTYLLTYISPTANRIYNISYESINSVPI